MIYYIQQAGNISSGISYLTLASQILGTTN